MKHTAEDCARFNHMVPGRWYGSNWDWVPCQQHTPPPSPIADGEIVVRLVPR